MNLTLAPSELPLPKNSSLERLEKVEALKDASMLAETMKDQPTTESKDEKGTNATKQEKDKEREKDKHQEAEP